MVLMLQPRNIGEVLGGRKRGGVSPRYIPRSAAVRPWMRLWLNWARGRLRKWWPALFMASRRSGPLRAFRIADTRHTIFDGTQEHAEFARIRATRPLPVRWDTRLWTRR